MALGGASCSSTQAPAQIEDACQLLQERGGWWRALKRTEDRWDAPPGLVLAIMRHESSFRQEAKPAREGGFLFLPGKRPSSAFGYAQATDPTWRRYQDDTGRSRADRDDFGDAADFVGWYLSQSRAQLGLRMDQFRAHYLAYHEGQGGYRSGALKSKKPLLQVADRVTSQARAYERQLGGCRRNLDGWWPF